MNITPVVYALMLEQQKMVRTDSTSDPDLVIYGIIAAWETPISTRTATASWYLYAVEKTTWNMLRPVNPATGKYFTGEGQARDDRTAFTYA